MGVLIIVTPLPQLFPGPPPPSAQLCILFFSTSITSILCCSCILGCVDAHWSMADLPRAALLKKTDFPFSSSYLSQTVPWLKWDSTSVSLLHRFGLVRLIDCHNLSENVCVHFHTASRGRHFLVFIHCFWLLKSLCPFPCNDSENRERKGCDIDVPFRAKHSAVSYSLHRRQLWVSVLITMQYKWKRL